MEEKSKIILRRSSEWMNRARGYKVFINDTQLGIIKNNSTEEYEVAPGQQQIYCKVDWCGSAKKDLVLKPGEIAYMYVKSNLKYFTYLYFIMLISIFGPFIFKMKHIPLPGWFTFIFSSFFGLAGIYILYFITLGRNKYLAVEEDKDNVFAK